MSPSLAAELARLLLAGASEKTLEGRVALEPEALPLRAILTLGERAREAGATAEELALALGLLQVLDARTPKAPAA